MIHKSLFAAALIAGSVLLSGAFSAAQAAQEYTIFIVDLDPWTQEACLAEAEELTSRLTGTTDLPIVKVLASEAEENCREGDFAEAQDNMNEAYRRMSSQIGAVSK
jgi:hypothetical protein